MRTRALAIIFLISGCGAFAILYAQKPFKEYPGQWTGWPLPEDYQVQREWTFARLRYDDYRRFGGFGRGRSWSVDYPRGDRHLVEGLRRLTRVDTRSVEQVIDLDNSDDVYNWPFLYAVEVGYWSLSNEEARQLRDFLNRGGFFMVDDFHGTLEWETFEESFRKVFPDKEIVELENSGQIFHNIYDLDQRFQVPGNQFLRSGRTYEKDGVEPRWRAVFDERGRVIAAICHNMDLGDAVERSDEPTYPEKFSSLAYRIVSNYVVYDLTH
jgi:hypothetical protein